MMNAAARVVSDTGKFDRGLKTILRNELRWLDVPERIEYTGLVSARDGHLVTSQTTSSQPLTLLLAVVFYDQICQPELSTQHVRLLGVPLHRPDRLELAARTDEVT